jgi:hypothetical protein
MIFLYQNALRVSRRDESRLSSKVLKVYARCISREQKISLKKPGPEKSHEPTSIMNAAHSMRFGPSGASTYEGLGRTGRHHQAITDAAFGFQQSVGRVGNFNFFSQVHHVDAQILRLLFGIGPPHIAQ